MEIRVAHVIVGLRIGGAERNLVNVLNALSCDYKACVLIGAPSDDASFADDLDADVNQFQVRIRRRSLPLGVAKLSSLFRRLRINVVHTHMYTSSLYGSIAAAMAGVPVVVTSEHGENPWKRPYQRWIERNVISKIAGMRFCVSERILCIRRDQDGVPESKLRVMINATVLPSEQSSVKSNPEPTIGAVGRFVPAKDYPTLIRAAAELHRRNYKFKLVILGSGEDFEMIQSMVAEMGLDAVVSMPGAVSDMDAWYSQFDIYVISSAREGLPVALLEAMAHGLPVVGTDVGAIAETVRHGEGGYIVAAGEPGALADALASLLDDAAARQRLGLGARRQIQDNYSVDKVAGLHIDTYRQLLTGSKKD